MTAAMDEDTHGDLKEIQRSCAKSAESIFGMAAKMLSSSGGMGGAPSASWMEAMNERLYRDGAGVCFHHRDVPCWLKCVGWLMKPVTEQDRIAARALAKNLIKQFEGMGLQRTGNSQDLIERACSLLRKEAANNGISPTVLKWYVSAVRTGEI